MKLTPGRKGWGRETLQKGGRGSNVIIRNLWTSYLFSLLSVLLNFPDCQVFSSCPGLPGWTIFTFYFSSIWQPCVAQFCIWQPCLDQSCFCLIVGINFLECRKIICKLKLLESLNFLKPDCVTVFLILDLKWLVGVLSSLILKLTLWSFNLQHLNFTFCR